MVFHRNIILYCIISEIKQDVGLAREGLYYLLMTIVGVVDTAIN